MRKRFLCLLLLPVILFSGCEDSSTKRQEEFDADTSWEEEQRHYEYIKYADFDEINPDDYDLWYRTHSFEPHMATDNATYLKNGRIFEEAGYSNEFNVLAVYSVPEDRWIFMYADPAAYYGILEATNPDAYILEIMEGSDELKIESGGRN